MRNRRKIWISFLPPDKMLLTEDQLGKVAGGSCYLPECTICGAIVGDHGYCINGHFMGDEAQRPFALCPDCGEYYPQGSEHTCSTKIGLF